MVRPGAVRDEWWIEMVQVKLKTLRCINCKSSWLLARTVGQQGDSWKNAFEVLPTCTLHCAAMYDPCVESG